MQLDPRDLLHSMGAWTPWLVLAGLLMAGVYVLGTMLASVSTMRYAIVGFYGRRGQGKTFSQVYYARKWAHTYVDKDVWTNLDRLDIDGRDKCIGIPRDAGSIALADGKTKRDAGFTLRHHVHNDRDCMWCRGIPHDGHAAACRTCTEVECSRAYTSVVTKAKRGIGQHCRLVDKRPKPLVHVDSEYMDFAHAYDGLVVVDEAGQVFASTMWAKLPFAAVKFMADTRKRRLLLLYSAHTPARVSKNLRELTDESFSCQSWKQFGFFRVQHWEGCLVETDTTTYVPFLSSVQHAYDTEEIVAPPSGLLSMSEALGRREVKARVIDSTEAA